jgi:hypothetical protein
MSTWSSASPRARGFDGDAELLAHRRLAEVFAEPLRADRRLDEVVFTRRAGGGEAVGHESKSAEWKRCAIMKVSARAKAHEAVQRMNRPHATIVRAERRRVFAARR